MESFESKRKKKKSNELLVANTRWTKRANLFISYGQKKLNWKRCDQICKGKSIEQQMDIDQEGMQIHFQEEILIEILSRLPVRSLQRFKCVSKFWNALISDPYFKMKHLNHAKNDQNSQKLLISQCCFGKDDMFSFYCSSVSSAQVVEDEQKLDCPSNCKPLTSMMYCCCDGLVLLTVGDWLVEHLLLWNPSTRESIVLPYPESSLEDCICGLGYDATSDDYKILAINLDASDDHKVSIEILTLKSGSWRKIGKYPTGIRRVFGMMRLCGMDSLAFVNGAFHWLGLSRYCTIVSLNISNEVYGEIPVLEGMCNMPTTMYIDRGVSVLRGMLCFYCTDNTKSEGTFKLWVMKNYGVNESWTQVLTIQDTNLFGSAKPKYMFTDGEVLLRCKHPSAFASVFRTSRGQFNLWIQCLGVKQGFVYTESLISPRLLI